MVSTISSLWLPILVICWFCTIVKDLGLNFLDAFYILSWHHSHLPAWDSSNCLRNWNYEHSPHHISSDTDTLQSLRVKVSNSQVDIDCLWLKPDKSTLNCMFIKLKYFTTIKRNLWLRKSQQNYGPSSLQFFTYPKKKKKKLFDSQTFVKLLIFYLDIILFEVSVNSYVDLWFLYMQKVQ